MSGVLVTGLAQTSPLTAQVWDGFDEEVRDLMTTHTVPGLALSIVRDGRVDLARGYGTSSVEDDRPVGADETIFRIGSVAKLFVATVVTDLAQQGTLDLHRDIREYVPDLPIDDAFADPITLHHLLTHTAGFDERLIGYAAPSRETMMALGDYLKSNLPRRGWPPGQLVGYSNHGMSLAAYIVEQVTGVPFDDYAREVLFERLGMGRTSYIEPVARSDVNVAIAHDCGDSLDTCVPSSTPYSHAYPVGLAYSTAADMGRFLVEQLGGGETDATSNRSAQAVALMQTEQFTHAPGLPGMSYGFFNQRVSGRRALAHSGSAGGFDALLMIIPEERTGFFFVINGGRSDFAEDLRDLLVARLQPELSETGPRTDPQADSKPYRLSDEELSRFAGPFQLTRYPHHTIESLPFLFAMSINVSLAENGNLWLPYDGGTVYEPIGQLRFRRVEGDEEIVFAEDQRGRITHLFAPVPAFGAAMPGALERRAWYDAPYFMNEYLSVLIAVPPIILLILWPVTSAIAVWRRRRAGAERSPQPPLALIALFGAFAFSVLFVIVGYGVVAASGRMFASSSGIVYGMTHQMRLLLMIPWVLAGLGALVTILSIQAWRRSYWGLLRRAYYSVIAGLCILTVSLLVRWNYLPPTW